MVGVKGLASPLSGVFALESNGVQILSTTISSKKGRGCAYPFFDEMVGVKGFEPSTPWSQTKCATRLRYTPTFPNPRLYILQNHGIAFISSRAHGRKENSLWWTIGLLVERRPHRIKRAQHFLREHHEQPEK
jgi:hypothetical protein